MQDSEGLRVAAAAAEEALRAEREASATAAAAWFKREDELKAALAAAKAAASAAQEVAAGGRCQALFSECFNILMLLQVRPPVRRDCERTWQHWKKPVVPLWPTIMPSCR